MQLNTRHFGQLEIDEKGLIDFPEGLPGFEDVKRFVLLAGVENDSPFQWLQGVDNTDLAFVVIDPKVFKPDYIVDVDDKEVEILEIKDTEKVMVLSIVVVPEDLTMMTANLKAPLLINTENNKGKQIVLDKSDYQIRHYILQELRRKGG
jgi:flagellar assembly factor FliW